ncbi:MAG: BrnT family toxin [Magnetococcales bacterium]|nr:BrnT family toxin [Magnetococcales bacterium]
MKITYDPAKRNKTLTDRGIDFLDAVEVFGSRTIDSPDDRHHYGEVRIVTVGRLRGRMVVVVWTPRGDVRHIISMRKANEREQSRFGQRLGKD